MHFFIDIYQWAIANRAPLLQFLVLLAAIFLAIGAFCGWMQNRLAAWPKWSAFFGLGAAASADLVKFIDNVAILLSKIPPMLGRRKPKASTKKAGGPFDDTSDGGIANLKARRRSGGLLAWAGVLLVAYTIFAFGMIAGHRVHDTANWDAPTAGVLEGCGGTFKPLVAPTAKDAACVAGELASDPNAGPADYLAKCGIATLDVLAQIVDIVAQQFLATAPPAMAGDGGPNLRGTLDVHAMMLARAQTLRSRVAMLLDGGTQ